MIDRRNAGEPRFGWNTDAKTPSGPGSDATEAFVYGIINRLIGKWRAWRGNVSDRSDL